MRTRSLSRNATPVLLEAAVNDSAAPELLERLVERAEKANASDVHLQMGAGGAQIMFRLDGVLVAAGELPQEVAERVFGRIKFLAKLKTYQESLPQDGRIEKSALNSRCEIRNRRMEIPVRAKAIGPFARKPKPVSA